jgi:hypothetical protein
LSYLPMAVGASVETCIRQASVDREAAWGSRFVSGYLLGYPDYLDNIDERFGAAVRQLLFDSVFGPEQGKELFRASMGHFLLQDPQTNRGWGAGAPDGERYFRALETKRDAEGTSDSLIAMFQIGSVDVGQQTL